MLVHCPFPIAWWYNITNDRRDRVRDKDGKKVREDEKEFVVKMGKADSPEGCPT